MGTLPQPSKMLPGADGARRGFSDAAWVGVASGVCRHPSRWRGVGVGSGLPSQLATEQCPGGGGVPSGSDWRAGDAPGYLLRAEAEETARSASLLSPLPPARGAPLKMGRSSAQSPEATPLRWAGVPGGRGLSTSPVLLALASEVGVGWKRGHVGTMAGGLRGLRRIAPGQRRPPPGARGPVGGPSSSRGRRRQHLPWANEGTTRVP